MFSGSLTGPELTQRVFEVIRSAVASFLLIVVFYMLQHIFDRNFVCSCKPGFHPNGALYLVLPPLILTFIVNIIEPFHRRKSFARLHWFTCGGKGSCFCIYILNMCPKYFSLSAVWIATVLFDGDWYFCVMTNLNKSFTGMPCREHLTYEELRVKDAYKTDSLDYGLYVICGFLCIWNIVQMRRSYCHARRTCCPPYYSVVYEELLAEQVNSHLNNQLKEIATKKAEAICKSYLEVVRNHELVNENNDMVCEALKKISASDFYLTERETRDSDVRERTEEQDTDNVTT